MSFNQRAYRNEYDYYKIREFLCHTLLLNERKQINWPLYRWDYWRWHVNANILRLKLENVIHLWETGDGELAAVLNPDGCGEAHLQIHPRHHSAKLIHEMLRVAEENLCIRDGKRSHLRIWAIDQDEVINQILGERGYLKSLQLEYQRWQTLEYQLPSVSMPSGYEISSLSSNDDLPARSWASWRAFHPDAVDGDYQGWEWYHNVQRIPTYRRDLDLIVIAPGGEIASFATVWWDEITRTAGFEPVGTVPEHQRKGLAKAVISEGLKRLKDLGALIAYVNSYAPSASATYETLGFNKYDVAVMWERFW